MKRLWPYAAIAAAAAAVWAPTLFVAQPGDSFPYDLNWSTQFTHQVLSGNPYPRWTGASFDGLGAPTFYFYPPLGFWITGLIGAATGGWASAALQVKLAELAFFVLSGWSMFAWLRPQASVLAALLGAVAYMVAPYHLDDHYVRGAFAELSAFVALPVVGLGLLETARGARWGPLRLAIGWAAVIFAHLPVALLTGAMLVAPYGLFLLWQARGGRLRFAALGVGALAAGTALAAIYLVPALALQGAISSDYWWSGRFQVAERLLVNPASWRLPLEPFFGALSLGAAIIAGVLGWRARKLGAWPAVFWACATIVVFLAVAGLIPGFWSLPVMTKVQFPWRALALQDFALVTVLVIAPRPARTPLVLIVFGALIAGNLAAVARDLAAGPAPRAEARAGYGVTTFPTDADAPEYLPAGMLRMTPDGPAPAADFAALRARPLAAGSAVSAARSPDATTGVVDMTLRSGATGQIVLRRFWFPSWRVTCDGQEVAAGPAGPERLVGFMPPGRAKTCRAVIGQTSQEGFGAILAAGGLATMALYAIAAMLPRRRRSTLNQPSPAHPGERRAPV